VRALPPCENKRGICIIGINTDDGIVISTSQPMLDEFRDYYGSNFKVRWGDTDRYGGVNVTRDREHHTITLDQHDFIATAWARWQPRVHPDRPGGARGGALPGTPSGPLLDDWLTPEALAANEPSPKLISEYQSCLGEVGWLANRTCPALLATYSKLGRAAHRPSELLLQECISCIAHAASDADMHALVFSPALDPHPVFYCDADFARHRSQSGWCGYMANSCVVAASKAQKCICLSTCESELVALSACTCDAMWLRQLLAELGFPPPGPTPIFCDNTAAKQVAENPVAAKQLKHVARRHFFVQDAVAALEVTVCSVSSQANLADLYTKIFDKPRYAWLAARARRWAASAQRVNWSSSFAKATRRPEPDRRPTCAGCGTNDGGMLDEMLACPDCSKHLCADCFPPVCHAPCRGHRAPTHTLPNGTNNAAPSAA
jgi:hypothetical protein